VHLHMQMWEKKLSTWNFTHVHAFWFMNLNTAFILLSRKKFSYIMWACHFIKNGNKLSISSWLTTEVQVCQNVALLNTPPPNLVLSCTALKIGFIVIFLRICCIAVKLGTNKFREKMEGGHRYLRWWSRNCSLKSGPILSRSLVS